MKVHHFHYTDKLGRTIWYGFWVEVPEAMLRTSTLLQFDVDRTLPTRVPLVRGLMNSMEWDLEDPFPGLALANTVAIRRGPSYTTQPWHSIVLPGGLDEIRVEVREAV